MVVGRRGGKSCDARTEFDSCSILRLVRRVQLPGHRRSCASGDLRRFVRAYRGIRGMNPETKLSTWLFGIARNVARESLRARVRANRQVDLEDRSVLDLSDSEPVPVEKLLSKELNDLIRRALGALDEDKRLVFTLKVFHHCSYEEIAEITGFSLAKLKSDLHRARAEMRRRIQPYAGVGYEV